MQMEERPDAPRWGPLAECWLKLEPVPLEVVSLDAPGRLWGTMKPVTKPPAAQRWGAQEQPVAQPPVVPEPQPQASSPEARPSQASPPEHAQRAALSDGALPGPQLPCAG
jgi:predicted component of type VI protein secretion system